MPDPSFNSAFISIGKPMLVEINAAEGSVRKVF
jgi:hypothetical protein